MARTKDAYNSTDRPLVITDEGHFIGGREHGKVDPDVTVVVDAVQAGYLILAEDRRSPQAPPLDGDDLTPASPPAASAATPKGRAR